MTDRAARLQQIYDNQGAPGVQAFRFAVRREGLQISDTEAKAYCGLKSRLGLMVRIILPMIFSLNMDLNCLSLSPYRICCTMMGPNNPITITAIPIGCRIRINPPASNPAMMNTMVFRVELLSSILSDSNASMASEAPDKKRS